MVLRVGVTASLGPVETSSGDVEKNLLVQAVATMGGYRLPWARRNHDWGAERTWSEFCDKSENHLIRVFSLRNDATKGECRQAWSQIMLMAVKVHRRLVLSSNTKYLQKHGFLTDEQIIGTKFQSILMHIQFVSMKLPIPTLVQIFSCVVTRSMK